jgi:fimbrial isopeptide formation D2 family protein/LPXTG-motif cell wall-anchored protein
MKKLHRIVALLLAALMAFGLLTTAFAATDPAPTIDTNKKSSLSIYKYDITTVGKDGAWDVESYVSNGLHDDAVIDKLSKYAIQGVEFTYLRVADITMNNELVDGRRQVGVLYGFDNSDRSSAVLSAIGLAATDAHKTDNGVNYFTSDMLNNKLAAALAANATTVKNALEAAVRSGGVVMAETDVAGHTSASDMERGLYLVVETCVPENVTSTCSPFFVSLPMTTIDGTAWNYDVTVYPKNQTGNPTLDKTVREDKNSTGKNTGSLTDITGGYAHTASASIGDTVDYQIISTMPTITSKASDLSEYAYVDTMSKGIKYNKNDVAIEFFKDAGCTDKITTWAEDSGKFTVAYDDAQNIMTIRMTDTGLSEINEAATVYTDSVKRGYSDCTMRISYAATLTADAKMGDADNPNEVVLTWRRTNNTYFDTLKDCCHAYTYGVDVLKRFSDNGGNMKNVKFRLHNDTDDCYIIADLKDGIYYAKGITSKKSDATTFIPNSSGHIVVKGLEDDTYSLTETATDKGYILLKDAVKIVIKTAENGQCEQCGTKLLTASATVNGKDVTMTDGNAIVPLTVVNNPGFDLPKTGGYGVWMYTVGGVLLLGAAAFIVIRSRKHKNER